MDIFTVQATDMLLKDLHCRALWTGPGDISDLYLWGSPSRWIRRLLSPVLCKLPMPLDKILPHSCSASERSSATISGTHRFYPTSSLAPSSTGAHFSVSSSYWNITASRCFISDVPLMSLNGHLPHPHYGENRNACT